MTQQTLRPAWVIEQTLNWRLFDCCGDEDLFPFKCWVCLRPLVLCYECDTLYVDLNQLNARAGSTNSAFSCPQCTTKFDDDFMRAPRHRITFDEWISAGFASLLVDIPRGKLIEILSASTNQLAEFLSRGMRSTARTRLTEYRNLAESLAPACADAVAIRENGYNMARISTLQQAMEWQSQLLDQMSRAFGLLGITDWFFPEAHRQPQMTN